MNIIEELGLSPSLLYFFTISLAGVLASVYDKWASRHRPRARVSEKNLFIMGALGGALAMYITMVGIRHKTKHRTFMVGFPAMVLAQLFIIYKLVLKA